MFPKLLQSLLWQVETPNNIYLHFFLSHTLRFGYLPAIHPVLKSFGTRCAFLEALTIGDAEDLTVDESFLLAETLRSCMQLRHLDRHDLKFAPLLNVTILNFYRIPHLEYIVIFCFDSDGDESDEKQSDNSFTAISQFLRFTQLRTLGLVFENYPVYLDNDLLLKAMSSWRHIRYTTLANRPPTITFRGSFDGLRLCPHLDSLQLHVDAVNIDIDPETESIQHTSLQKFNVGFSNVEDVKAAARIIFSMLPGVEQVRHADENEWDKVNKHLEDLKSSAAPRHHITPEPAPDT
ncbi:hypothetical protein BDR05DRAFT_963637 [Suillus weaverae]|nr:hypothetical protein BDR05DRAFT_963637 [Suillus weaverae]